MKAMAEGLQEQEKGTWVLGGQKGSHRRGTLGEIKQEQLLIQQRKAEEIVPGRESYGCKDPGV